MYNLIKEFSKYVHASPQEMNRFREEAGPLIGALTLYQKEDFENSINYLIRTHSLLIRMIDHDYQSDKVLLKLDFKQELKI